MRELICEILGSHGGGDVDVGLLGCDAVQTRFGETYSLSIFRPVPL
jgi:hypothetical protein